MLRFLSRFTTIVGSWIGLGIISVISGLMVTVMLTPLIAASGVAIKNTIGIFDALPDFIAIDRQAQKNEIYAQKDANKSDGYVHIADVFWQNRVEIHLNQMSPYLKYAAVDGEDRRFYEHKGVDLTGLIRAGLGNFVGGGVKSGASTLTMQVIKNIYVQRAEALPDEAARAKAYAEATATTMDRKLKEIKLAIGLEKRFTKAQILQAYLNISGFGGNTYGVQAAAYRYFGKPALELDPAEAASLIAIVQYPMERNLAVPANYPANEARRNVILQAMRDAGDITDQQYQEAINTKVDANFVHLTTPRSGCIAANKFTKFFCDYVVKNVTNFEALGSTVDERITNWHIGGYKLYTTMNFALQQVAQKQAWRVPNNTTALQMGGVTDSVEVGTGRVLTMAQNKLFNDTLEGGGRNSTAVNFSTDKAYGGSSGFQTGSTYKIMALITWLKAGRGLGELVNANEFKKNQALYADSCGGPWGGTWEFKNDSQAPKVVSVLDATKFSINSAYASIGQQLDQCEIKKNAESLGIHRADGAPLGSNPAAILGTNELAPLTMATAWAGIANEGKFCSSIVLDHATGPNDEPLPGQTSECHQAIDPEIANAAIYAMQAVMSGGTGTAGNPRDGVPVFGKTGTTDSSVQTWLMMSTSKVATATWVGNIVGKYPMRSYPNGALYRFQIASTVMRAADKMYPGATGWPAPPARLLQGNALKVPAVQGLSIEAATTLLKGLGFQVKVGKKEDSDSVAEGFVASSEPGEGEKIAVGMTIILHPSAGIIQMTMPDVGGMLEADAQSEIQAQGLSGASVQCQAAADPTDPTIGYVVGQSPGAGTVVTYSDHLTITVLRASC